jgi:hypothetical protein
MIDIRIDGESADLLPTTSLVLERFNPLLDFEKVQGSRVYGFNLPDTPINRRLLGYFYQDQVGYKSRRFRCEKYVGGQRVEDGYVMVQDVDAPGFSLYFTQDLNEIFGDYQQVPLSQLSLGREAVVAQPVAAANHLTDRYCYPTIQNPAFYGNQGVPMFNGLVNEYSANSYNMVARVPMPFLRWIVGQFSALTGWSFVGDFWKDADLQRLILFNLYGLDEQTTISAKNHVPGLTMPQLIIDLRRLFNLYLEFDLSRKVVTMDFADKILATGDVVDWTDKANPTHKKNPELVNRLELGYELDSNDGLMKPVPAQMDIYQTAETTVNQGGGLLPIKSRVSTLLTDPATGRAMTQQAGITTANNDNKNAPSPKLLFWNGVQNGVPLATATSGARSLYWRGANNLVDVGYRQFETFRGDTFNLTKIVSLTPADLALFSFRRKVHIKGVNYIVGSIKAQLTNNSKIVPTELQLCRA